MKYAPARPQHLPSIREAFDSLLTESSVDCFSLFAEDLWQPGVLIPQEVDLNVFYPEAMYAVPGTSFHSDILNTVKAVRGVRGLRAVFFDNAREGPAATTPSYLDAYEHYDPLFRAFLERERIVSTAVFVPREPSIAGNTLPELLFFNFRARQRFAADQQQTLCRLAQNVLEYVPVLASSRNRGAYAAARKTIRSFSSLTRFIGEQLRNPTRPPGDKFYAEVAKQLHEVQLLDEEKIPNLQEAPQSVSRHGKKRRRSRVGPKLIVSIYLQQGGEQLKHEGTTKSMARETSAEHPVLFLRGSSIEHSHKLRRQRLFDSETASITVCTAVTGCPLLIHRVDPFQETRHARHMLETSLELTAEQARVARSEPDVFTIVDEDQYQRRFRPRKGRAQKDKEWKWLLLERGYRALPSAQRLVLRTPASSKSWRQTARLRAGLLRSLQVSKLGKRWPTLVEKVRARSKIQYAHFFGHLDARWSCPSSEVCVPIKFAEQTIGCVNIESAITDRFNATYIGLLSSFAAVIGTGAARELDLQMMNDMQYVIRKIHSLPFQPDGAEEGTLGSGSQDGIVSHVSGDTYGLNQLARSLARACWAQQCFVVSTGSHQDEPCRFLACSDVDVCKRLNWHLPLGPEFWEWLAAERLDSVGTVIDQGRPEHELFSLTLDANADAGTNTLFTERVQNPAVKKCAWRLDSAARAVVIRLPSTFGRPIADGPLASGMARTMVALMYDRKMFEPTLVDQPRSDRTRSIREHLLQYIYSLCIRCSGVADHWNSQLLTKLTQQEHVGHSAPIKAMEDSWPKLADGSWQKGGARCVRRMKGAVLGARIAQALEWPAGQSPLGGAQFQLDEMPLDSLIAEAIETAKAPHKGSHDDATRQIDRRVRGLALRAHAPYLFYLITQAYDNYYSHSKGAKPGRVSVRIRVTALPKSVLFEISDDGVGFPKSWLGDTPEYRRRMPVLVAGRQGRGFDLMLRVARHLNPNAPPLQALKWGNRPRGGAYLQFEVPRSLFHKSRGIEHAENHSS